jgi:transposase
LLWVPGKGLTRRQRAYAAAIALRDEGYQIADIAMKIIVSERTVRRILERYRTGKLHPNVLEFYEALRAPSDTSAQEEQSNPEDHTRR